MKKTLLLLSFVLATIAASAQLRNTPTPFADNKAKTEHRLKAPSAATLQRTNVPKDDKPTFDPEGTEESYIMAYTDNNGFYEASYTNGKGMVRKDGSTWYFNGLTPGGNRSYRGAEESWLRGEKEGDEIVIKAGQMLVQNQAKTLYLEIVHADADGNITSFEQEARLRIGENGELTTQNDDIFAIYEDAEVEDEAGFFGFFYNMEAKPMGELVRFEFPNGVQPETYVFTGTDAYGTKSSRFVKVAFADGKFFVSGLASTSPDEVYEGTYTDTEASIPSFQIVKDADLFYYRIAPVYVDEDYNFEYKYNITFTLSPDRKQLTLSPEISYLCETTYDLQSFATTAGGVTINYYAGDHAAKPATPEIIGWDDNNDALAFNIPTEDVDGGYVNPEKLSYRIYADGKRYTFTPSDYERLSTEMNEIPFGFTDNFDIVNNGVQKIVYFHNLNCKLLEVASVYTVDGVETTSDRALYDFDPTTIIDNAASTTAVATEYHSLSGVLLTQPTKGSVVLQTVKYASGKKVTKAIKY